jgi:hypothetical protein
MIAAMQIAPSLAVLSALGAAGQAQPGAESRRGSPGAGPSQAAAGEPEPAASFERPPEGTPVRRGMLVDVLA